MRRSVALAVVPSFLCSLFLAGCGGSGGSSNGPSPPDPGPGAPPMLCGDVHAQGTITVSDGSIDLVELRALDEGYFELDDQATASVRLRGSEERQTVPMSLADEDTVLRLGPVALQVGMNLVEIAAPDWWAVRLWSGAEWDAVGEDELRQLSVGFQMLPEGAVVAPSRLDLYSSCGEQRWLSVWGLTPGDHVRAEVRDTAGGLSVRTTQADDEGFAELRDLHGGLTWYGYEDSLALYFARDELPLP